MPRAAIIVASMLVALALLGACAGSASVPGGKGLAGGSPTPPAASEPPSATPSPTSSPTSTPTPTRTPLPGPPTAREDANLRAGPGVTFPKIGSVQAGDVLQLVATNPDHDWVQVIWGPWILADLVANVPDLPVVQVPSAPSTTQTPEPDQTEAP